VDRIFLQAYVPLLESVGMVGQFLRWQRGYPRRLPRPLLSAHPRTPPGSPSSPRRCSPVRRPRKAARGVDVARPEDVEINERRLFTRSRAVYWRVVTTCDGGRTATA